jgi:hypothetical protein
MALAFGRKWDRRFEVRLRLYACVRRLEWQLEAEGVC